MPQHSGVEALAVPMRRVTRGPDHHFFGYYEKTPWSADGTKLLAMRTRFAGRPNEAGEGADIGVIDLEGEGEFEKLDETTQWSWQQGAMLQWLGSDADRSIIYNRAQPGQLEPVACVRDIRSGQVRMLDDSIYAVTPDASQAVSLDFHRLQWLRPGYGYVSPVDAADRDPVPADRGITRVDLATGRSNLILSIREVAEYDPVPERHDCPHWVNHLQINTTGSWFAFLHRWLPNDPDLRQRGLRTRLMAARLDGTDLRTLCDTRNFSHYDWRDDRTILGWANPPFDSTDEEPHADDRHFYLFDLDGNQSDPVAPDVMLVDGHCSYSPAKTNRHWVLNDTYEDEHWYRTLYLWNSQTGERHDLGRFLGQPRDWPRDARCDLHPRWNRVGTQVCIDSAHDGTRQMYLLDVSSITG